MASNNSLRLSYSLLAPIYDRLVKNATAAMRQRSLHFLNRSDTTAAHILINGIGSGLDIPFLPQGPQYVGLDLTANMLKRARHQIKDTEKWLLNQGDAMCLPYRNECFDIVVLHLILAVTPDPQRTLNEVTRVLKPQGHVLVLDKFLKPGQRAPLRRLLNPISSLIATRTDVILEQVLENGPNKSQSNRLVKILDEPELAGGWFRRIVLQKSPSF